MGWTNNQRWLQGCGIFKTLPCWLCGIHAANSLQVVATMVAWKLQRVGSSMVACLVGCFYAGIRLQTVAMQNITCQTISSVQSGIAGGMIASRRVDFGVRACENLSQFLDVWCLRQWLNQECVFIHFVADLASSPFFVDLEGQEGRRTGQMTCALQRRGQSWRTETWCLTWQRTCCIEGLEMDATVKVKHVQAFGSLSVIFRLALVIFSP